MKEIDPQFRTNTFWVNRKTQTNDSKRLISWQLRRHFGVKRQSPPWFRVCLLSACIEANRNLFDKVFSVCITSAGLEESGRAMGLPGQSAHLAIAQFAAIDERAVRTGPRLACGRFHAIRIMIAATKTQHLCVS